MFKTRLAIHTLNPVLIYSNILFSLLLRKRNIIKMNTVVAEVMKAMEKLSDKDAEEKFVILHYPNPKDCTISTRGNIYHVILTYFKQEDIAKYINGHIEVHKKVESEEGSTLELIKFVVSCAYDYIDRIETLKTSSGIENRCKHIIIVGKNKGNVCGKNLYKDKEYCVDHVKGCILCNEGSPLRKGEKFFYCEKCYKETYGTCGYISPDSTDDNSKENKGDKKRCTLFTENGEKLCYIHRHACGICFTNSNTKYIPHLKEHRCDKCKDKNDKRCTFIPDNGCGFRCSADVRGSYDNKEHIYCDFHSRSSVCYSCCDDIPQCDYFVKKQGCTSCKKCFMKILKKEEIDEGKKRDQENITRINMMKKATQN